jgi:hypothetical protein
VKPTGGLARRLADVQARARSGPTVALDAGDTIFHEARLAEGERPAAEARARLLLAGLARMRLAALAVGERELALGLPWLEREAAAAGVPLLAANVAAPDGRRPFAATAAVDAGGQRVGIVAAVGAGAALEGLAVADPAAALRAAIEALRSDGATLVVALLHMPASEARALLAGGLDVDVAIAAHEGRRLDPEVVGRALLVTAGERGREALALRLDPRRGEPWADAGAPLRAREELVSIERWMAIARDRLGRAEREADRRAIEDYLAVQAERAEDARARERRVPEGRLFEPIVRPLGPDAPEDPAFAPEVARVLAAFGSPPEPISAPSP